MRKIKIMLSSLIIMFLASCGGSLTYTTPNKGEGIGYDENYMKKATKKDKLKNGVLYYSGNNYSEENKWVLKMYNSINKSILNDDGKAPYGYNGQKILKNIKVDKYKNGLIRVVFLSTEKNEKLEKIFIKFLYSDSKNKYSEVISSIEPTKLEIIEPIDKYTSAEYLVMNKTVNIQIPVENEPNNVYGFTTDDKVRTLKIEGKNPDGIKEFKANGIRYFFLYYDDLKSDKEVDKYKIEYEK